MQAYNNNHINQWDLLYYITKYHTGIFTRATAIKMLRAQTQNVDGCPRNNLQLQNIP